MTNLSGYVGDEISIKSLPETENNYILSSNGGDLYAGLAVFDVLSARENITIHAAGMVASAATLILLSTEQRYGTANSRYLIHNPFTFTAGDASELSKQAKEMQFEQDEIVKIYAANLTLSAEEIEQLMKQERILSAQEALEIGLIKEIKSINTNTETMTTELSNELSGIKLMLSNLAEKIGLKRETPKNIILQDVNGTEIEIPGAETVEAVTAGMTGTVNGEQASGEFVMPEGETYVFENGTLTEIKEAEAEPEQSNEELEALKAELETLKAENEALKIENKKVSEVTAKMQEIETRFNDFKNKFSDEKADEKQPAESPKMEKSGGMKFKINKFN